MEDTIAPNSVSAHWPHIIAQVLVAKEFFVAIVADVFGGVKGVNVLGRRGRVFGKACGKMFFRQRLQNVQPLRQRHFAPELIGKVAQFVAVRVIKGGAVQGIIVGGEVGRQFGKRGAHRKTFLISVV